MYKYFKLTRILYNNDMEMGLIFSYSSGKMLDRYAERYGMKRKWFLFIPESDLSFKARLMELHMKEMGLI